MTEHIKLDWRGPYAFKSGSEIPPILCEEAADVPGIYCWVVPVNGRILPHYVGETGSSVARRQCEHFRNYASGIYGVADIEKFLNGEYEETVYRAPLWKKEGWRTAQKFIDNLEEYSHLTSRMLSVIRIYFAELVAERRIRRRIEGGLINSFYRRKDDCGLFPKGFRCEVRDSTESVIKVTICGDFPIDSLRGATLEV